FTLTESGLPEILVSCQCPRRGVTGMPEPQWDVQIPLVVHLQLGAKNEWHARKLVRHVVEAVARTVQSNTYQEHMEPGPAGHVEAAVIELDEAAITVRPSTGEDQA